MKYTYDPSTDSYDLEVGQLRANTNVAGAIDLELLAERGDHFSAELHVRFHELLQYLENADLRYLCALAGTESERHDLDEPYGWTSYEVKLDKGLILGVDVFDAGDIRCYVGLEDCIHSENLVVTQSQARLALFMKLFSKE